ncbi:D-TA family PLP-dependent enzyme [soil metagenome]
MTPTPSVRIDVDLLQANIEAMQVACDARGVALRPHAKTHKSLHVGRRQLAAGAVGLSVATVGEGEVFADLLAEHERDLLVAYPVAVDPARLLALGARVRTIIGVDSLAGVDLAAAAGVAVSIEVDCGLRRSGVRPLDAAAVEAYAVERGVEVVGVFTFPGHGYAPGGGRAEAARDEAAALAACDVVAPVRSGGAAPTVALSLADPGSPVTELRPGVYVFGDAQQVALGATTLDRVALSVRSTVVSTAVPGQVVLDAGAKVLGVDRPPYVESHGLVPAYPHARLARLWEHHGVLETGDGPRPALGEVVDVVPNHVCSVVNLVDDVHAGDEVWPVDARGRNG